VGWVIESHYHKSTPFMGGRIIFRLQPLSIHRSLRCARGDLSLLT
jgi:hypothetical protein